ncbi:MAG: transposase, partial [Okeania sp. SIO3B3]|nr:transposase [Okeania sp. SIO3B3]
MPEVDTKLLAPGLSVLVQQNVRTFDCPHCGMRIDRDLNAALVLSQYGEVNQFNRVGCTRIYACEL